ncbi:MAG: outer membrane protein assembly factor [Gemmatimonadota bacterium]|nr:outer membrane protein assembly factor [Gemmatimonadota bacterium]
MKTTTASRLALLALCSLLPTGTSLAQVGDAVAPEVSQVSGRDTTAIEPDTLEADSTAEVLGLWARQTRSSGLMLSSGKTYNRVEGLPVQLGPVFRDSVGSAAFNVQVLGIIRSADTFHWDSENLGHRATADVRVGRGRGYSLAVSSYDVVTPVETWQLGDPDASLATLFGHRDFRDYFGRHGARASATFHMSARSSVGIDWSDERWQSRRVRSVFSVFGNGKSWRANPTVDAGRFHLGVLRANVDTRNDELNPATGWLILAEYERGTGSYTDVGPTSPLARQAIPSRIGYGRTVLDLRRYNRVSPSTQLNARLVLGGWLHGDELPLQRRFSVGGIGTLPGFDFRRIVPSAVDVAQCGESPAVPAGVPAQCERVALVQLEYRSEINSPIFDFLNARPIRLRGIGFTVEPTAVAFVDAGRGWLVGPPSGTLQYRSGSIPAFGTFRTDLGLGLDLGIIGIYVAKAVSDASEPANFFLRVRRRF